MRAAGALRAAGLDVDAREMTPTYTLIVDGISYSAETAPTIGNLVAWKRRGKSCVCCAARTAVESTSPKQSATTLLRFAMGRLTYTVRLNFAYTVRLNSLSGERLGAYRHPGPEEPRIGTLLAPQGGLQGDPWGVSDYVQTDASAPANNVLVVERIDA